MSTHIWKLYLSLYIYTCMHNKLHTHRYMRYRHIDSLDTFPRRLQLLTFLSVGRNVIFHNNEVIVYFLIAILLQELDILGYLLPWDNSCWSAEGTSKAKCFLIPRRPVLSHGNTHTHISVWHFFLIQVNGPYCIQDTPLCFPLKSHLCFPACKILYQAV